MTQADSADTTTPSAAATTLAVATAAPAKSPGKSRNRKRTATPRPAAADDDTVVDLVTTIEQLARDSTVDPERLKQLLPVWEHQKALAAEQEFNRAMALAQAEMEPVRANCRNDQTRSKYASYDALDEAIRPAYTRHGFSVTFDTEPLPAPPPGNVNEFTGLAERVLLAGMQHGLPLDQIDRLLDRVVASWKAVNPPPVESILIVTYVSHSYVTPAGEISGHTKRYAVPMPCDGKGARDAAVMTRTHATGSAITYGRRYGLGMAFNITITKDDDGNAAGRRHDPANAAPARTLADRPADKPAVTKQHYARTVTTPPRRRLEADLRASAAVADPRLPDRASIPSSSAKLRAQMEEAAQAQVPDTGRRYAPREESRAAADIPALAPRRYVPAAAPDRAPAGAAPASDMAAQLDLDNRAYAAAREGCDAFRRFCPTVTKAEFDSLRPILSEIEKIAIDADDRRRKEAQKKATPAPAEDGLEIPDFLRR